MAEPWQRLVAKESPKSPVSEAFRVLRTNMQYAVFDKPLKTVLITSAGPSEGKSTTVANLGVTLAQSGANVIMLDGDLRRPSLHKFFRLTRGPGLTSVLFGLNKLEEAMLATELPNLRILPSGPVPPNPSEMLSSQAFGALLEQLKAQADYVLIDSPPAVAVADASIIGAVADGILLVVELGRAAKPMAVRAKEQLLKAKGNLLGVILTNAGPGSDYSYYYEYYYHYQDSGTP